MTFLVDVKLDLQDWQIYSIIYPLLSQINPLVSQIDPTGNNYSSFSYNYLTLSEEILFVSQNKLLPVSTLYESKSTNSFPCNQSVLSIGNTFKKSEEFAIIQNIDSDSAKENVLAGGDNVKTEPIVKQEQVLLILLKTFLFLFWYVNRIFQIDVLADDGFGYPVSNKDKILRLLILGSREPIYNATQKKITIDDMTDMIAIINNGLF